jgi:hypothetical protein
VGIIDPHYYDAFISYAHDDNVLHDDAVWMFYRYLKPRLEAEFRLRDSSRSEAKIFIDSNGLPANGDLSAELNDVIARTAYLIIFIGRSYPNSTWCGKELELFVRQFSGVREEVLERVFVIVLDKAVESKDWGRYLDTPSRPIFARFYDEETGQHFPPTLEDKYGQAVPGPRFLRGVRRIAETMAERSATVKTHLGNSHGIDGASDVSDS